ncbi:uncharacterized protein Tco025E_05656 [Trypanosoma conorhini]|uniref:F-box domain-containing protein n=1 Tax=Trypanosoma conorhini TaxID=83891 RepID=A0A3R7N969_9TRYP|nr:uncharacterized protein Tco025E_05656 [Trypanosoma conorhini]RNF14998.1 hypothetical protein Tco025E_05656 [Trypanosoma conorhini]
MPHFFGHSSVSFLERFQLLQRCGHGEGARRGRLPTDALSLMDVLLHINSIFTIFSRLKHALDTAQTSGASQGLGAGDDLGHAARHLQEDMSDFDRGLAEEVLGPLLLSCLSFYVHQSIGMVTIRRALCALLETTPYLREVGEEAAVEPTLSSNIALLLLNLSRALLRCQAGKELLPRTLRPAEGEERRAPTVLPLLPWLLSSAEHATQKPTWYWWESQNPRTLCGLIGGAVVYRSPSCEAAAEEDAFSVSYAARAVAGKRGREAHDGTTAAALGKHEETTSALPSQVRGAELFAGILSLPYVVQGMILEYLSPRALSAAVCVCKAWWMLIERWSPVLRFYLLSSRAVTRVFLQFFEDDWGKAWVRVDALTTFRRLALQQMRLRLVQNRLQQRRASAASLGNFVVRLYGDRGTARLQWRMLEGLWNAIEVEMKLLPFLALREARLPSLLRDGAAFLCCSTLSRGAARVQVAQVMASLRGPDRPCLSLLEELLGRWSLLLGVAHAPSGAAPERL